MLSNSERRVLFFIIAILIGGSIAGFFRPTPAEKSEKKLNLPINVNSASVEDLTILPGIGEVTAKKILEYRIQNKGFKTKNEIIEVNGIGEFKFEKMKDKICVERLEEAKNRNNESHEYHE